MKFLPPEEGHTFKPQNLPRGILLNPDFIMLHLHSSHLHQNQHMESLFAEIQMPDHSLTLPHMQGLKALNQRDKPLMVKFPRLAQSSNQFRPAQEVWVPKGTGLGLGEVEVGSRKQLLRAVVLPSIRPAPSMPV